MGIDDINDTLKKHIRDNVYVELTRRGINYNNLIFHESVPLNTFRGWKIAFDTSNIMYAKMTTAHNNMIEGAKSILDEFDRNQLIAETMKGILGFFALIFKAGITPVCVFDGPIHPYKEEEIKRRGNLKKNKTEKIEKLMFNYINTMPLDRTQEMEQELRHELRNNIRIMKSDYELMKQTLENIGICCIDAPHDGEQICSRLNREGIVNAVYSTDTDNYAHGASVLISEIKWDGRETVCNIVRVDELLLCFKTYCGNQNFGLEEFIDLCIMHGCDYNSRTVIPTKSGTSYKNCGGKSALDCIVKFGRFENFTQDYWPCFGALNIMKCREIFYYQPTGVIKSNTDLDWNKFKSNLVNILNYYKVDGYLRNYFLSVVVDPFHIKSSV